MRDGLNDDGMVNTEDCSKCTQFVDQRWDENDNEEIRNRFVTGNLAKAALRNALPAANTEEENDDVYGDFEDLETGEKHENHQTDDALAATTHKGDDLEAEERRLKKLALRAKFDSQYPFISLCIPYLIWTVTSNNPTPLFCKKTSFSWNKGECHIYCFKVLTLVESWL